MPCKFRIGREVGGAIAHRGEVWYLRVPCYYCV